MRKKSLRLITILISVTIIINQAQLALCSDKDPNKDDKHQKGNRKSSQNNNDQTGGQDTDSSNGSSDIDEPRDSDPKKSKKKDVFQSGSPSNPRRNRQSGGSSSHHSSPSDQSRQGPTAQHQTGYDYRKKPKSAFRKFRPFGHGHSSTKVNSPSFVPNPNNLPNPDITKIPKDKKLQNPIYKVQSQWGAYFPQIPASSSYKDYLIPDQEQEEDRGNTQPPQSTPLRPSPPLERTPPIKSSIQPQTEKQQSQQNKGTDDTHQTKQTTKGGSMLSPQNLYRRSSVQSTGSSAQQMEEYIPNYQFIPFTLQRIRIPTVSLEAVGFKSNRRDSSSDSESQPTNYPKYITSVTEIKGKHTPYPHKSNSRLDSPDSPRSSSPKLSSSQLSDNDQPISQGSQSQTYWRKSFSNSQHQDQHEQQGRKQTAIRYRQTPYHQRGHSPGPYSFSRVHGATTNQGSLRGASRSSSPSISPTRDQHAEISPSGYHSFPPLGRSPSNSPRYSAIPYEGSGQQSEDQPDRSRSNQ